MRIALVSTCALTTPPEAYGGTELVVAELAHGLVSLGHDVTVFATGDSRPHGQLRFRFCKPVWPPDELVELRHAAYAWEEIVASSEDPFDVVHVNHAAAIAFAPLSPAPTIVTLHHERVERLVDHYLGFRSTTYVAVSRRQAELVPELRVSAVIHHGLDPACYPAGDGSGGYVAFLGRFAREKAPHVAIRAARTAQVPLRLGGAAHEVTRDYFEGEVAPLLHGPGVEWLGELSHAPKVALLQAARALLFPIGWEEPFGLVMIESMLVGTPVVAFARGSAPEVVEHGVTGFLVETEAEMADAIGRLHTLDRVRCRARAIERWSHVRMAREYLDVYERAIDAFVPPVRPPPLSSARPTSLGAAGGPLRFEPGSSTS